MAEARQRRLGAGAMLALGAVTLALVLQHHWARQTDLMHDVRSLGPLRATVRVDGTALLGTEAQALHRGEAFGWINSFCVPPQTAVLMQARLVRSADGQVVVLADRDVPADARGCSSSAWDMVLPLSLSPGQYRLDRSLLLTPRTGPPDLRSLPGMMVEVRD